MAGDYCVGDVIRVVRAVFFAYQEAYVGQFGVVIDPKFRYSPTLVHVRMLRQDGYHNPEIGWAHHEIEKITDPGMIAAVFLGE